MLRVVRQKLLPRDTAASRLPLTADQGLDTPCVCTPAPPSHKPHIRVFCAGCVHEACRPEQVGQIRGPIQIAVSGRGVDRVSEDVRAVQPIDRAFAQHSVRAGSAQGAPEVETESRFGLVAHLDVVRRPQPSPMAAARP